MEWGSTAVLIIGVILTSFNIFPLNVWFSFIGNFGWIVVGVLWRKLSLIIISSLICFLYIVGLVSHYF